MVHSFTKKIGLSLIAVILLAAACKQAPVRPITVDMSKRRGEGEIKKDPKNDTTDPNIHPQNPGTDPETPGTDPETPGTDPETPGTDLETPGTDPETPGTDPETPMDPKVSELFTKEQFNKMLPHRIPFYTYEGFIEAAEATPGFAKTGTVEIRKREIAAMLANALHESDDFKAVREYNQSVWGHYCMPSAEYPCKEGQTYQGRGPIQLSWNYNYINAGKALGVDLYNNPDLVATDPKIAFQTLMWFWMTQGAPGLTCHDAIVNNKGGFAQTIRTINGGLECDPNSTNPAVPMQRAKRISNYEKTLSLFGQQIGNEKTNCLEPL